MENNELSHHGVKGQKWGVRRYQNPDGSLKAAGRKRYGIGETIKRKYFTKKPATAKSSSTKTAETDKKPEEQVKKKKSMSEMTDQELANAIRRSQMEAQYMQLHPQKVSAGKQFIGRMMSDAVVPAAVNSGRRFLETALNKMIDDKFGDKSQDTIAALRKTYEKMDLENRIDKLKNPDKYESWDDKKKRREYEDETARRKAEADEAARKENESKYRSDPYTRRAGETTNVRHPYMDDTDPVDVVTPKPKTQALPSPKPIIDADYTNVTNSTASSGRSYVSDYLNSGSNSQPSPSTIALGQRQIAGYLPAPKDDD